MKKMLVLMVVFVIFGMGLLNVQAQDEGLSRWEKYVKNMDPEVALDFAIFLQEKVPPVEKEKFIGGGAKFWNDYHHLNKGKIIYISDYSSIGNDFSFFDFTSAVFMYCDFYQGLFKKTVLEDAIFFMCVFVDCKTEGVDFTGCKVDTATFLNTNIDFKYGLGLSSIDPAYFFNVNFKNVKFSGDAKVIFEYCILNKKTKMTSELSSVSVFISTQGLSKEILEEGQRLQRVSNGLPSSTETEEKMMASLVQATVEQINLQKDKIELKEQVDNLQQQLNDQAPPLIPPIPPIPEIPTPVVSVN